MNPVESVVSQDDTTWEPTEDSTPTQSFFPTVAVIENSLEASTTKPETDISVPFIPNNLPEPTSAVTDTETPSAVEEESTEDTFEEPGDIITPDTKLETITGQEEDEAEPEVEDIPPTEHDGGGEAEPEEQVTDGKATSD